MARVRNIFHSEVLHPSVEIFGVAANEETILLSPYDEGGRFDGRGAFDPNGASKCGSIVVDHRRESAGSAYRFRELFYVFIRERGRIDGSAAEYTGDVSPQVPSAHEAFGKPRELEEE